MPLQASVFEWKIIHLEGHSPGEEGRPARSDREISYTLKCLWARCNLSGRGEAGDPGSLVSVSICHSHPATCSFPGAAEPWQAAHFTASKAGDWRQPAANPCDKPQGCDDLLQKVSSVQLSSGVAVGCLAA